MMAWPSLAWHGSDRPLSAFGGEGRETLHVGTLDQAAMRSGNAYLHLLELPDGRRRRTRDRGSDNARTIARARRDGVDFLSYLNRYEGMDGERLDRVLKERPGIDLDRLSDAHFRRLFPDMSDSTIVLDPASVRLVGCYRGRSSAYDGLRENTTLGGLDRHLRAPGAELTFARWIGKTDPTVIPEGAFNRKEMLQISDCRTQLERAYAGLDFDAPDIPGLRYREIAREGDVRVIEAPNALLAHGADGAFLGGIARGVVYVEPHARGRGVATALHVHADETRCVGLRPSHFSEGGLAARRAAHRALCARALERGDPVHDENRETYGLAQPADAPEI